MKDELIWCDTKEKLKKVAQKLKSDGFSIADTERIWNSYGEESVLSVHTKEKCITYCSRDWYKMRDYATPITADEFLGEKKRPSIVIFQRGRNVIAKDVATGNEGIAKCSPNDEFNFHTGASIALARLMSKVPATGVLNPDVRAEWKKVLGIEETTKKVYTDADRNFKVGDRVVVRDWDDMVNEYGLSKWGDVKKDSQFTSGMKHLCGHTATVTAVEKGLSFKIIKLDFDDEYGTIGYTFNPWMFNPIDIPAPEKEKPEARFKVGDYVTLKEGVEANERYGGLPLLSGPMHDFAYHKRMRVVGVDWQEEVGTYYYECYHDGKFTFHYSEEMLDKWDESKIHEGDTVKVINTGLNYSSYVKWVEEHISDPSMAARFCFSTPETWKKYKVIKIAEHERNHSPLAYIEETDGLSYNKCYLIEVKGLEKV